MKATILYPKTENYIESLQPEIEAIGQERKLDLKKISDYICQKVTAGARAQLNFICTHNSRRSILGQIWAATAAHYYGIKGVEAFSGGTESTALNPRVVAALERTGFQVVKPAGKNPRYEVSFNQTTPPVICYSKTYDDSANPSSGFLAIMTCTDADENCPFIAGSEKRVAIPYEDPKVADGTEHEAARYDERCRQIAAEMFFVMGDV